MMMKYVFISMDHFYIAAFVASSKLNDLSQNAPLLSQELYFQIPVFEKINTHERTFYFFASPQNGLNLPTLLADAVLIVVIRSTNTLHFNSNTLCSIIMDAKNHAFLR